MSRKFRKKPIVIEAILVKKPWKDIRAFCPNVITIYKGGPGLAVSYFFIPTLEGKMTANIGDWIIRGINGEFYPCKPDIFEKTYKRVEESL